MATNLEFIKSVNVQTASSTVQITDCFTDNFDVYKITLIDFSTNASNDFSQIRFINSGGTTVSSSNYDYAYYRPLAGGSFAEERATNQTYIRGIGGQDVRSVIANANAVFYVFNPTASSFTFMQGQSSYYNSGNSMQAYKQISVLKTTDDITGLEFFLNTNSIDELRASVYGVK